MQSCLSLSPVDLLQVSEHGLLRVHIGLHNVGPLLNVFLVPCLIELKLFVKQLTGHLLSLLAQLLNLFVHRVLLLGTPCHTNDFLFFLWSAFQCKLILPIVFVINCSLAHFMSSLLVQARVDGTNGSWTAATWHPNTLVVSFATIVLRVLEE